MRSKVVQRKAASCDPQNNQIVLKKTSKAYPTVTEYFTISNSGTDTLSDDIIHVNGSNNLPNLQKSGDT